MPKVLVVTRGSLSTQEFVPSRSIFCRILEPLSYLQENARFPLEIDILKTEEINAKSIRKYDVVVFCKHNTEDSVKVLRLARQANLRVIYDIDDLIHRFAIDSAAYTHMKNVDYFKEHIEAADVVVASTDVLNKVILEDFNIQCSVVIRTGINTDKYYKKNYQPACSNVLFTNGDNIKVNFFRKDFYNVFNQFLNQYSSVELDIFGDSEEYVKDFARYRFLGSLQWDQHKKYLAQTQYKFAIVPLGSNEEEPVHHLFSNCKTPIKYLEYSALRIPGIYSNAAIYQDVIQHQETGILVENSFDAWKNMLEEVYQNTELRRKITDQAFDDVNSKHHIRIAAQKWAEIL